MPVMSMKEMSRQDRAICREERLAEKDKPFYGVVLSDHSSEGSEANNENDTIQFRQTCTKCGMNFRRGASYAKHTFWCQNDHKCQACLKNNDKSEFSNPNALHSYWQKIHEPESCELCTQTFEKGGRERHMTAKHSKVVKERLRREAKQAVLKSLDAMIEKMESRRKDSR